MPPLFLFNSLLIGSTSGNNMIIDPILIKATGLVWTDTVVSCIGLIIAKKQRRRFFII